MPCATTSNTSKKKVIMSFQISLDFFWCIIIGEFKRRGKRILGKKKGEVRGVLMGLLWNISNLWRIEVIYLDCDNEII